MTASLVPTRPAPIIAPCVHRDPKRLTCGLRSRRRTGPLAKMLGRQPACELVGAPPDRVCADRVASHPAGTSAFAKIGRMGEEKLRAAIDRAAENTED